MSIITGDPAPCAGTKSRALPGREAQPRHTTTTRTARTQAPRRLRVAIVTRFDLVAETFAMALWATHDAVAIPAHGATSAPGLARTVLRRQFDIVLVDLDLGPVVRGELLVEALAAAGSTVVVLGDPADEPRAGDCLRRGAEAVVSNRDGLRAIATVLDQVTASRPLMDPEERARLAGTVEPRRDAGSDGRERLEGLTARERAILLSLMQGLVAAEIARRNVLSEATIRTQIKSILSKLGVGSQLSAVALAHQCGWMAGPRTA